jgi:hypothetical protein
MSESNKATAVGDDRPVSGWSMCGLGGVCVGVFERVQRLGWCGRRGNKVCPLRSPLPSPLLSTLLSPHSSLPAVSSPRPIPFAKSQLSIRASPSAAMSVSPPLRNFNASTAEGDE